MIVVNTKAFVWRFGSVTLLPGSNILNEEDALYLATDKSFEEACKSEYVYVPGAGNEVTPEKIAALADKGIDDLPPKAAKAVLEETYSPNVADAFKKKSKNPKVRDEAAKVLDHILNGETQV